MGRGMGRRDNEQVVWARGHLHGLVRQCVVPWGPDKGKAVLHFSRGYLFCQFYNTTSSLGRR